MSNTFCFKCASQFLPNNLSCFLLSSSIKPQPGVCLDYDFLCLVLVSNVVDYNTSVNVMTNIQKEVAIT